MSLPLEAVSGVFRYGISPLVQVAVLVGIVLWWRKPDREELFPFGPQKQLRELQPVGTRHRL